MTIINGLKLAKYCHYFLYLITFVVLFVVCHIFYIKDAIEESQMEAKSITKRSMDLEFEPPAITICPKPAFKPSISRLFNLSTPVRSLFLGTGDPLYKPKNITDVQELYEDYSYANDLTFLFPSGYVLFRYIHIAHFLLPLHTVQKYMQCGPSMLLKSIPRSDFQLPLLKMRAC